jgi:ferredoxin-NADP reductase
MNNPKKVTLTLQRIIRQNADAHSFYFSTLEAFHFTAGQYIQIIIPHDADERGSTRFFSIASSPAEKEIMLTIKEGKSSFKKKLFSLQAGDMIDAFGPIGKFILEV